ncbi:related to nucleolar fibrillarin NOP77 (RRM superfamily) [Lecanosticta acicola]|uniref:Related to nucleolar fibrillarin NOP77 (RRM superfamily) n=1 Tax=Lecanosticta acicola TaxID=111012 RepID=A0AAI8Z418_9PEZI|nr:related to nucleolar fibrillarin NOP77 (RRM superfamily) [Lecanosticta acicola]
MGPARKKQRLSNGNAATVSDQDTLPANTASVDTAENTAEAQEKAVQQRRSLFVRSLPASTTSDSLTDLFSDSYPVKHAVAVVDPSTKECRGYGFVTFADAEDAARARRQFNGHALDGRKLRIEVAEPRHRNDDGEAAGHARKVQEEPHQPPKLIVRNLPWSIKRPEQLSKLFMSYGKVKQAYIPKKGPGLMAGFGFVIMRGKKNAEKAIEGVNGKEIDGRTVAVDWSVQKTVYEDMARDQQTVEDKKSGEDGVLTDDDKEEDGPDSDGESGSEDSERDSENQDEDGVNLDMQDEDEAQEEHHRPDDRSFTLFVRNLPFTCTDEDLEDHFTQFGSTRYARVVVDHETGRSKGTGFVCFYNQEDADACLRGAPVRLTNASQEKSSKDVKPVQPTHSILQNEYADPTGQYTMDGRVLQISRAVDKSEASRLTDEGAAHRTRRDNDKRRLYLLSEGTISSKSKLWEQLSPSEKAMREASAKQRKTLIESNPSLHLSLTRLSVRNIPRSVGSKELKELARQAVVGFATDVKEGVRQKLSSEELARGGEESQAAEKARKKSGKGLVKQAKVVFESTGGSKVSEDSGAGRSRGYGFIEYYTHRNALMGLRWLNGHAIGYQVKEGKGNLSREDIQDRKKRLIVEFAIENAQVVLRRKEAEQKARARSQAVQEGLATQDRADGKKFSNTKGRGEKPGSRKRKRDSDVQRSSKAAADRSDKPSRDSKKPVDEKLARRNQIIGKKRAMRARKKGSK